MLGIDDDDIILIFNKNPATWNEEELYIVITFVVNCVNKPLFFADKLVRFVDGNTFCIRNLGIHMYGLYVKMKGRPPFKRPKTFKIAIKLNDVILH